MAYESNPDQPMRAGQQPYPVSSGQPIMDSNQGIRMTLSWQTVTMLALGLLVVWFIANIWDVVLIAFGALLLASALLPLVNRLSRRMPRWVGTGLVYLLGLILIAAIIIPIGSSVISQAQLLGTRLPDYTNQANTFLSRFYLGTRIPNLSLMVGQILDRLVGFAMLGLTQSLALLKGISGIVWTTLALLIFSFLMLVFPNRLKRDITYWIPANRATFSEKAVDSTFRRIGAYIRGLAAMVVVVGLLTTFSLWILRIDFALALGSLAGLAELVPFLGPFFAGLVIFMVALAFSPLKAIAALALYVFIQWLTNRYIGGVVRLSGLDALMVILAVMIGASLFGVVGAILAVPLATLLQVLLQNFLPRVRSSTG